MANKKSPPKARVDLLAADQKLINGVQQFLNAVPSLSVGGTVMTPAAVIQLLQGRITASQAAEAARVAHAAAVKVESDTRTASARAITALKRLILGMYLELPSTLAIFGLTAPKAGLKSAAVKAEAAAKGDATRKANHPTAATAQPSPAATPSATRPAS